MIYEFRHGVALLDPGGVFQRIRKRTSLPMGAATRRAGFFYLYVEMRGLHRNADNPMDRGDRWAVLTGVVAAANHALRCAYLLDGRPYPYIKWLHLATRFSPTAAAVRSEVDDLLVRIVSDRDALCLPEAENAVSQCLRRIRRILIERARTAGIDEPWLTEWWRSIEEARAALDAVAWPSEEHWISDSGKNRFVTGLS